MVKYLSFHPNRFILCFKGDKIIDPDFGIASENYKNGNKLANYISDFLDKKLSYQEFYDLVKKNKGIWIGQDAEKYIIMTDIYGTVPAYLYQSNGIGAVFTHFQDVYENINDIKLTPDPVGITEELLFDNSLNQSTNFKEIRFLPPASIIFIDFKNEKNRFYWS